MKRIFLLCILVMLVTGCTSIKSSEISSIVNETLSSVLNITNTNRNGYSYYLPRGISVKSTKSFNERLEDDLYQYYLYVDVVSYNNKTGFKYTKNNAAYFSNNLENNGKYGYIEINNYTNNQYLIEIMYNYAKIEVIVMESDINKSVAFAISLLTSVTYNNSVISKNLSSNILDFNEEKFDIFEIVGSDNYLQFGSSENQEEVKKDPDYVK